MLLALLRAVLALLQRVCVFHVDVPVGRPRGRVCAVGGSAGGGGRGVRVRAHSGEGLPAVVCGRVRGRGAAGGDVLQ
jgi:hypothetical protein